MPQKYFYITTPLFYVNDRPHLGTAYSAVVADIFNRYHKLFGYEAFFLTGTDEHGQKCEQAARENNQKPEEHCEEMRERFKEVWEKLGIKYTPIGEKDESFFYTSHKYKSKETKGPDHTQIVQNALKDLKDKGDIYQANYKGWYCVSEEIFYTEKDLIEGKSPSGKEVIPLEEKAWFFKMSKYQEALLRHIENHPEFIQPLQRRNEVQGFLKKPLQDLCVSRPKARVSWGIELPFDKNCVVYVWVDALLNYITGLGYQAENEEDKKNFENFWNKAGAVHLIGKDILMTHAVYWPCLLLALGLKKLPKTIFAHGWLLNQSAEKMSKSKGDKLDPLELLDSRKSGTRALGVCGLRCFLAKHVILGKDSAVSKSFMIQKANEDLSDSLGNIFSRVSRLIEKDFKGKVPKLSADEGEDSLQRLAEKVCAGFRKKIEGFELSQALSDVFGLLSEVNKHLEQKAPWKLVKSDKAQAGGALSSALEALRISAILLYPVMPSKMQELLSGLGQKIDSKNPPDFDRLVKWGSFPFKQPIKQPKPLFPKIKPA